MTARQAKEAADEVTAYPLGQQLEPRARDVIATFGQEQLRRLGFRSKFSLTSSRVAAYLAGFAGHKVEAIDETTRRKLARTLGRGVAKGEGIDALASRVVDVFAEASRSRAATIARTEVLSASNFARFEAMRQTGRVEQKRWLATKDDRVRDLHAELDGQVRDVLEPFEVDGYSAQYPGGFGVAEMDINCFLPGTTVDGAFVAAVRSTYSGSAIEIETRGGARLRVTPNHPVSTSRGLTPAHAIAEGSQVLRYCVDVDPVVRHDAHHGPSVVEDVFRALLEAGEMTSTVVGAHDLHGDAHGVHGEVDVVASDRLLWRGRDATKRERSPDIGLVPEDVRRATLPRRRGSTNLVVASMSTPHGVVGGPHLSGPGSGGHATPLGGFGRGLVSHVDALLAEYPEDRRSRDAEAAREFVGRSAGKVRLDDVIRVREFDWSGHVFDLQSGSGLLVADGIVASNCRCTTVPVVATVDAREDADDLFEQLAPRSERRLEQAARAAFARQRRAVLERLASFA